VDLTNLKVYLSGTRESAEEVCRRVRAHVTPEQEGTSLEWESKVHDCPADIELDSSNRKTITRMLRSFAFEAGFCNDHATLALVGVDALGNTEIVCLDDW